uniref:Uncharacterized protein n=1 Tax=Timema monikensis TaxID=170555 RepID=A0A7R9E9K7_9NEOP|nr:unnamed protein product [Timema monikensis]
MRNQSQQLSSVVTVCVSTELRVLVGYRTVAIDHVLEETVFESKKKKKKGEPRDNTDLVPPPRNIAKLVKYFSNHPPVYEKDTKIFGWNYALYSADAVFDCCAHAHIGGEWERKAGLPGRKSTVALAVPALA